MHPGRSLRRLRERHDWTMTDTARAAGLSLAYLSRVEAEDRDPTWSVLTQIAAVWGLEPTITFIAAADRRTEEARRLAQLAPDRRLWKHAPAVFESALRVAQVVSGVAITGAPAAVLHGVVVPAEKLELLVLDRDEHLETLITALQRSHSLYGEMSPADYRDLGRSEWYLFGADAHIRLVADLPITTQITLDETAVAVVALHELAATDVRVAETLLPQVGSNCSTNSSS